MNKTNALYRIALACIVVVSGCVVGIILNHVWYAPAPEGVKAPEREVEPPTLTIVDSQHKPRTNVNEQKWIA
jgi:hypothetical protein